MLAVAAARVRSARRMSGDRRFRRQAGRQIRRPNGYRSLRRQFLREIGQVAVQQDGQAVAGALNRGLHDGQLRTRALQLRLRLGDWEIGRNACLLRRF